MSSVPRSFSSHGRAHGRLIQAIAAHLRALVDQYGNRKAIELLERGVAIDVDYADDKTDLGGNWRQGLRHFLAEVAIGAMVKDDLHGPENIRKGMRARQGGVLYPERA